MLTFNFVLQKVKAPAKLKVCSMFNILLMDKAGPVLAQVKYTDWCRPLLECKNISLSLLSGGATGCGLAEYQDDFLITFGAQDNAGYILKVSKSVVEDFINE